MRCSCSEADQRRLTKIGHANTVLQLRGFILRADWPQAYPVQDLLVERHRVDENRDTGQRAQLALQQFRSVRIGEGSNLEKQASSCD